MSEPTQEDLDEAEEVAIAEVLECLERQWLTRPHTKLEFSQTRIASRIDLEEIAAIHAAAFPRQGQSKLFVDCMLAAYPLTRVFVALADQAIIGYAIWTEKSGFRERVVLEIAQVAVAEPHRRQGQGMRLLLESFLIAKQMIAERGGRITSIITSTAADNPAVTIYRRLFNMQQVATIRGMFAQPEIILLGKH